MLSSSAHPFIEGYMLDEKLLPFYTHVGVFVFRVYTPWLRPCTQVGSTAFLQHVCDTCNAAN